MPVACQSRAVTEPQREKARLKLDYSHQKRPSGFFDTLKESADRMPALSFSEAFLHCSDMIFAVPRYRVYAITVPVRT